MNAFGTPRPGRPVNARVSAVSACGLRVRADRLAGDVPASGASSRAVPTATAAAPAASAAADLLGADDATGGDDGQRRGGTDLGHQVGQRPVGDRALGRERPRVAAGRGCLHHQDVEAGLGGRAGLLRRGHRLREQASRPDGARATESGSGSPKVNDTSRGAAATTTSTLALPVVVVLDRAARAGPRRSARPADGGRRGRRRRRAGRPAPGAARRGSRRTASVSAATAATWSANASRLLVARGQEPEAPRLGSGQHQGRRGRAAGHRGGEHRQGDAEAVQEWAPAHRPIVPLAPTSAVLWSLGGAVRALRRC